MVWHFLDNVAMPCTYCGHDTRTTNSRPSQKSRSVWRRHHCHNCGADFTTYEYVDLSSSHLVLKRNGKSVPFSRDKLLYSIVRSIDRRHSAISDSTELTRTIIAKILRLNTALVPSEKIYEITAKVLKNFDRPGYIRYTSFHQN